MASFSTYLNAFATNYGNAHNNMFSRPWTDLPGSMFFNLPTPEAPIPTNLALEASEVTAGSAFEGGMEGMESVSTGLLEGEAVAASAFGPGALIIAGQMAGQALTSISTSSMESSSAATYQRNVIQPGIGGATEAGLVRANQSSNIASFGSLGSALSLLAGPLGYGIAQGVNALTASTAPLNIAFTSYGQRDPEQSGIVSSGQYNGIDTPSLITQ